MTKATDKNDGVRARLALAAGGMGSWVWNIAENTVTGDARVADFFGMDPQAAHWEPDPMFSSIHPEDEPTVREQARRAIEEDDEFNIVFRVGDRWIGGRGSVGERDEAGNAVLFMGVNWDATKEHVHEQELSMLAREMDHRVKNAFAVMRALVNLGQRSQTDLKEFSQTLRGQIQAMSDAHTISARVAREKGRQAHPVPVAEVISTALAPWLGGKASDVQAIALDIDTALMIRPDRLSSLAMIVYELTTNATKYGPLGERGGKLNVTGKATEDRTIVLRWEETMDTPAVAKAAEEEAETGAPASFGSTLIQHCASALQARVKRDLTPQGLIFELHLPALATAE